MTTNRARSARRVRTGTCPTAAPSIRGPATRTPSTSPTPSTNGCSTPSRDPTSRKPRAAVSTRIRTIRAMSRRSTRRHSRTPTTWSAETTWTGSGRRPTPSPASSTWWPRCSSNHEVKAGLEVRSFTLKVTSFTLQFEDPNDPNADPSFTNMLQNGNIVPADDPDAEGGYIQYEHQPAADLRIHPGQDRALHIDHPEPGRPVRVFRCRRPIQPGLSQELVTSGHHLPPEEPDRRHAKHMVSPRISVSYPITDQGTIRFSYGHFYQIGSLSSLYTQSEFPRAAGDHPVIRQSGRQPPARASSMNSACSRG